VICAEAFTASVAQASTAAASRHSLLFRLMLPPLVAAADPLRRHVSDPALLSSC
jgi:hypothetical protein